MEQMDRTAFLTRAAKPMILVATLIWGSTFFILKDTLNDMSVFFMLAFRFTLAAVLLAVLFWKRWRHCDKGHLLGGGVMGGLLFCAYTVQNYGLLDTTPGKNAFFTAIYCIIVPFLYWAIDRTRPDRFNVLAAVMCVGGIGLVSWDGSFALSGGDWLTLLGGCFYACHIVAVAHFAKGRDIFLLTTLQFATVGALCWLGAWITGGLPTQMLPPQAWTALLYLAVVGTTLALLFQNVAQKYTDPSAAAVLLSLEAPFGVMFSMAFYSERPSGQMFFGFALIFLAVICSETKFQFFKKRVDKTSSEHV